MMPKGWTYCVWFRIRSMTQLICSGAAVPTCCTLLLMGKEGERIPFTRTALLLVLSFLKSMTIFVDSPSAPRITHRDRLSEVLKAEQKSMKAKFVIFLCSSVFSKMCLTVCICSVVDLPGMNPPCCGLRKACSKLVGRFYSSITNSSPGTHSE